jgi:hypothetical protein
MTEKKGHFESGRWVEDTAPEKGPAGTSAIEARIIEVSRSVSAAIDDVVKAGRDLVETEEGRRHMEKTVKDAGAGVQKAIQDILRKAKEEIEQSAPIKKK